MLQKNPQRGAQGKREPRRAQIRKWDELRAKMAAELSAKLIQELGSPERLEAFLHATAAYQARPSIENYLRLRSDFPEKIVARSIPDEEEFGLQERLKQLGIDPMLLWPLTEADTNALCLKLMERLIEARTKRHRGELSSLVNYLIARMLETAARKREPIPESLVRLAEAQLCGPMPDLRTSFLAREKRHTAALNVAVHLVLNGKKLSIRGLRDVMGISKTAAENYLKDPEFQHEVKLAARALDPDVLRDKMERAKARWPSR